MIGLVGVKDYVHRLEEVFARGRDGALALDREALDQLFEGGDGAARRDRGRLRSRPASSRTWRAALAALAALARARSPGRPAGSRAPRPPRLASRRMPAAAPVRSSMVRVDFAKLDHLLNLVGELIIYRTKLSELARQRRRRRCPAPGPRSARGRPPSVACVSTQLQETIMDVRMLPIRHVFERFPRLVRDLARQQGKQHRAGAAGRGDARRQGRDRRARRAARAPDPQRGRPRHRGRRRFAGRAASRRPARCCSRRRRSRTRS